MHYAHSSVPDRFDRVPDHREPRGKRWALSTLLFTSLFGIMSGQKGADLPWKQVDRVTARQVA